MSPGVIKEKRRVGHESCLKGFTGREHIDSVVLLASSVLPAGVDEQQVATITGAPTGGTFTLTFRGAVTSAIAFNATAATVEDALEALATIENGDVRVTGSAGGPYTIQFHGGLGRQDVDALTASGAGLTGGTSPAVAITTAVAGDPTDAGRLLFRVGTVLTKVPGNPTKVRRYTAQSGEAIIGINNRPVELVGTGPENDTDLACVDFGAKFDKNLIIDYATYQAALDTWAAANACKFA